MSPQPSSAPCLNPAPPRRPWRRAHDVAEHYTVPILAIIFTFMAASGKAADGLKTEVLIVGAVYLAIGALLIPLCFLEVFLIAIGKSGKRKIFGEEGSETVDVVGDVELSRGVKIGLSLTLFGIGSFVAIIPNYIAAGCATAIFLAPCVLLWYTKDEHRPASKWRTENKNTRRYMLIKCKTGEVVKAKPEMKFIAMSDACLEVDQRSLICPCKKANPAAECRFKDTHGEAVCIACAEGVRRWAPYLYVRGICYPGGEGEQGCEHSAEPITNAKQAKKIDYTRCRIFQCAAGTVVPTTTCPCIVHSAQPQRTFIEKVKLALFGSCRFQLRGVTTLNEKGKVAQSGKPKLKKGELAPEGRMECLHELTKYVDEYVSHRFSFAELLFVRKIDIIPAGRHHDDIAVPVDGEQPPQPKLAAVEGQVDNGSLSVAFMEWSEKRRAGIIVWREAGALWTYRELRRRFETEGTELTTEKEIELLRELRDIFAVRYGWVCLPGRGRKDVDGEMEVENSKQKDIKKPPSDETVLEIRGDNVPLPIILAQSYTQLAKGFAAAGDPSFHPIAALHSSPAAYTDLIERFDDSIYTGEPSLSLTIPKTILTKNDTILIPFLSHLKIKGPKQIDDGETGTGQSSFEVTALPSFPSLQSLSDPPLPSPDSRIKTYQGTLTVWWKSENEAEGVWLVTTAEATKKGRNGEEGEKKGAFQHDGPHLCVRIAKGEGVGRLKVDGFGFYEGERNPRVEVVEVGI
ncbi:hypothetical protein HDV00_012606 [Rhizophlyctis rosea]|nr:hypothetical protein HDV00_012606 [Rhizophlyctis rosea]